MSYHERPPTNHGSRDNEQQCSTKMQNQMAHVRRNRKLGKLTAFFSLRNKVREFRRRVDKRAHLSRHKMESMLADYPNVRLNSFESNLDISHLSPEIERDMKVVGEQMRNTIQRVTEKL